MNVADGTGSQMLSTPKRTAWPCRSFSRLLNVRIGLAPKDVLYFVRPQSNRRTVLPLFVAACADPTEAAWAARKLAPKSTPLLDDVAIVKDVRLSRRGD